MFRLRQLTLLSSVVQAETSAQMFDEVKQGQRTEDNCTLQLQNAPTERKRRRRSSALYLPPLLIGCYGNGSPTHTQRGGHLLLASVEDDMIIMLHFTNNICI